MQRLFVISVLASLALAAGCSDAPPEPSPSEKALQDPMNYKPAVEPVDVSGGGITDLDKKAFRKDIDHVLSP